MNKNLFLIVLVSLCLLQCKPKHKENTAVYEAGEELLAGTLGTTSKTADAFGFAIEGLSFKERAKFAVGNSLFNQSWVSAPASTTARDGLGPTFNARACASCHVRDGRGKPILPNSNTTGFLMRVSRQGTDPHGGPLGLKNYGTQLHDRSNRDIPFEAKVKVSYDTIYGAYPDKSTYTLLQPKYYFEDEQFGKISKVMTSPRVAPQTIGMGLISALPDSEILKFADEHDQDGDGISGKPNYVWNYETNQRELGKYGLKANAPSLKTQIASAFIGDMGLTNPIFPNEGCPDAQADCQNAPNGGTPEITAQQLDRVLFYQAALSVPNRRNAKDKNVLAGKVLFKKLNCIGCHAINQVTGNFKLLPSLENITIKPFSDFLLHDMGNALADHRPDYLANGQEWRTPPLWGIGLLKTVNNHTYLLHDGRARNIEEAILWHGGEAQQSKTAFKKLSKTERDQLLAFVNSL